MLTRRDCPEFARGGGGRRGGVKAVEGWRSPRPGGLRGGIVHNEHTWGLRRRVSEADRAAGRRRNLPESWCGFDTEDVGDEALMSRDCPEIGGHAHSPSPGGIRGGGEGTLLSSLTGLVPLASANPPFETVGYSRSSPRDFSRRQGSTSIWHTRGVAARHPWLLEWHPFRMHPT